MTLLYRLHGRVNTLVIQFLLHFQIVDLAILVKEDQEGSGARFLNTSVSINQQTEAAKIGNSSNQPQIPKGALPTPTHSPPGTPISQPTTSSTSSNTSSLTSPVHGGLASSLGTAYLASSLSGLKQPKAKKKKTKVK